MTATWYKRQESGKTRRKTPGGQYRKSSSYQTAIKKLFFVILSAAKNLSFQAAEILHSAALRSE
jgi:hypothetical protein